MAADVQWSPRAHQPEAERPRARSARSAPFNAQTSQPSRSRFSNRGPSSAQVVGQPREQLP